jgi:hypothetical protein
MRERGQMFAMQKYTLMFGAVLIPLIMKMTIGLLGGIGTALGSGDGANVAFGVGGQSGGSEMAGMVAFSLSIVPPYLVIYSIIASAAISDAEGRRSSCAMYFIGLCAASMLIFHFINL